MKYYNIIGITQFSWLDPIGLFSHAPSHILLKLSASGWNGWRAHADVIH